MAEAVGKQALAEGVAASTGDAPFVEQLRAYVWEPVYRFYQLIPAPIHARRVLIAVLHSLQFLV